MLYISFTQFNVVFHASLACIRLQVWMQLNASTLLSSCTSSLKLAAWGFLHVFALWPRRRLRPWREMIWKKVQTWFCRDAKLTIFQPVVYHVAADARMGRAGPSLLNLQPYSDYGTKRGSKGGQPWGPFSMCHFLCEIFIRAVQYGMSLGRKEWQFEYKALAPLFSPLFCHNFLPTNTNDFASDRFLHDLVYLFGGFWQRRQIRSYSSRFTSF